MCDLSEKFSRTRLTVSSVRSGAVCVILFHFAPAPILAQRLATVEELGYLSSK